MLIFIRSIEALLLEDIPLTPLAQNITNNSFVDTSAEVDSLYYYFIEACNATGCSEKSSPTPVALMGKVKNQLINSQEGVMKIQWQQNAVATSYNLYRNSTNDFTQAKLLKDNIPTNSFIDTTALDNSLYHYFLVACYQAICSEESSSASGFVLASPENIQATAQDKKITLLWEENSFAGSFSLFRGLDNNFATAQELSQRYYCK